MEIKQIGKIVGGQDGAIFGGLLFRFGSRGQGYAYDLSAVDAEREGDGIIEPLCSFTLDKAELIAPHSNAVFFGTERYEEGDELPLLYSNIYNNYAKDEDRLIGVCCVYRVERTEESFKTTLVQLIRIGFTDDGMLWCSEGGGDVRPYGNFTIDRDRGIYWAFVMRDATRTTRYFAFRLPRLADGTPDETLGVRCVTLTAADILKSFDCDYHDYVQGACLHGGKIYSVEGFHADGKHPPVMRVIDTVAGAQERYIDLVAHGCLIEPECIDFIGERCYDSDAHGTLYLVDFT